MTSCSRATRAIASPLSCRISASGKGQGGGAGDLPPWQRARAEYTDEDARAASERDPFASYMQLCTYSAAADRANVLGCSEAEVSNDVVWQRHRAVFDALPAGTSFLRKVMALDLAVYLPGLGLAYNDRASMEHGVEVRVPWLDLELVRWSLTLPDSVLIRGRRAKWLPKELTARDVSPQVAWRAKRGFAAPARHVAPERIPGSRAFARGGTSPWPRPSRAARRGIGEPPAHTSTPKWPIQLGPWEPVTLAQLL